MQLHQEFTVDLPVDKTWALLTDVQAIAPCLPGARLTGSDGDSHSGEIKIKVGPVTAHYLGTVEFIEKDDAAHHAVLDAAGKEARGSGTAKAKIDVSLAEAGTGTTVTMVTDLGLTGRVAQFGRGIISDVSSKLLGQFVTRLEAMVAAGDGPQGSQSATSTNGSQARSNPTSSPSTASGTSSQGSATAASDSSFGDDAPLDLGSVVGPEVLKRVLVPAASALGGAALMWLLRRRSGGAGAPGKVLYLVDARHTQGHGPW